MNTVGMIEQSLPELIGLTLKQNCSLWIHNRIEGRMIEDSESKTVLMKAMETVISTSSNFTNISYGVCQHHWPKTIPA